MVGLMGLVRGWWDERREWGAVRVRKACWLSALESVGFLPRQGS